MKQSIASFIIAIAATTGFMVNDHKANADAGNQELCPVMGFHVTNEFYTDYQGYRIFFCCSPCPSDFKDAPDVYMKQLHTQNIILAESSA